MNSKSIGSRARYVHFAAFALIGVLVGCNSSDTGTFSAQASEKAAAEKGLRPGGPAANNTGKVPKPGRPSPGAAGVPSATP
jgi:hypothetical protein